MPKEEMRFEIWDIAKARAAKCVSSNRRMRGIREEEVADNIALMLYPQQDTLLSLLAHGKADEAEAIIREAIRKAKNEAVSEARKSIRALVPYQVRRAKESGRPGGCGNGIVAPGKKDVVDEAYSALGRDMVIWRHQWCDDERVNRCIRFTLGNLAPVDRQIGFLYLELCSWGKVAERMKLSEGDFRRKHLPRFKENFAAIWRQVW